MYTIYISINLSADFTMLIIAGRTFFKMTEMYFEDAIDDSKYLGHLYGLGTTHGDDQDRFNGDNKGSTPALENKDNAIEEQITR